MNLDTLKGHVEDFLNNTTQARILSERDRDYKDHKQWTAEEQAKLTSRNQAAIIVNRIKPKVDGLKGLLLQRKTDPKAYPRTEKHAKAAEAVTDGMRYVADNNTFEDIKLDVADNVFVEGYGAAIIEVERRGEEQEIKISHIPWDRYYFDPHSRRLDFADKRFDGVVIWMDAEEVVEKFKTEASADDMMANDGGETFDDRPRWIDQKRKRVKVCQHFFKEKGVWNMAYFTGSQFLVEPAPSPYLDEFGEPRNPIEAIGAYIDRNNNRFGEVRYWIDLQDEINHRRSKFLHLLSERQTVGKSGAVVDVAAMKRELAKPNGHVEYQGEKGDFDILGTGDMSQGQFTLLQDAKSELDAVGFNAQLSGERQGDLSGKAISNLQQAATNELSSLYAGLSKWEQRIYRQVWQTIKQFWDAEKWVRVTDDRQMLRWVGFNQQVTMQQVLEEQINDESLDLTTRQQSSALYQQMQQAKDPRLGEIQEIRNNTAEMDMDIMIEVALDSINVQQEQFEMLANIAQTRPEVPFKELIRLSTMREKEKDKLIASLEQAEQAAGQRQQQVDQVELGKTQAEAQEKQAKAQKIQQESIQTSIQNQLLMTDPPEDPSVIL